MMIGRDKSIPISIGSAGLEESPPMTNQYATHFVLIHWSCISARNIFPDYFGTACFEDSSIARPASALLIPSSHVSLLMLSIIICPSFAVARFWIVWIYSSCFSIHLTFGQSLCHTDPTDSSCQQNMVGRFVYTRKFHSICKHSVGRNKTCLPILHSTLL